MGSKPITTKAKHPLVGAGLHYKDEDGCVQNQAVILEVVSSGSSVGDLALIQYFEWFGGEPSTRRLLPLTELANSDRWVFYADVEEMKDHHERVDRHHPKNENPRAS
jgi:hypothetical protein